MRKRLFGTTERPRLTVTRSNRNISAQIVCDREGKTLVSATSVTLEGGSDIAGATEVGKALAEKAKAAGIEKVVFDRNGYRYHGRVQALADAVREGGVSF
jgi:large subunit ribosomal protein L18